MNRPGPGSQPLRSLPNGMFPQNQQNAAPARGAPALSARFQNGKIGGGGNSSPGVGVPGSGWGMGTPLGTAPGLSNPQQRANNGGMTSFAQTLSGSQPHSHIDLSQSDFPTLSNNPQAQQQNASSQSLWSNPNLRIAQHTPIPRPQVPGGGTQVQGLPNALQAPRPSQTPGNEEAHLLQGQMRVSTDDYRFGGQGGVGQLSGSGQPQTSNIEEFPPLGGEIGPDRRAGLMQNATFGGIGENNLFPNLGQTRNGVVGTPDGQGDRSVGDRGLNSAIAGLNASRTQLNPSRGAVSAASEADRNVNLPLDPDGASANAASKLGSRPVPGLGATGFNSRQTSQVPLPFRDVQQPGGQPPPQLEQPFSSGDTLDSPGSGQPHKRLAEMTDSERFGLPGLLAMIPNDSLDHSSLAVGQDLTVLGLDLNRPDNSPLYPTFGSPFSDGNIRPVIPDFTLPHAYTVTNVPPLHSKIQSFSAETLLAIFYQYPRDIMQEIAAGELYNRDWRWHKVLRQWMMKDPDLPPPVPLTEKAERGWYIFFDVMNWRRERREFELNYDHLDQRHGPHAVPVR